MVVLLAHECIPVISTKKHIPSTQSHTQVGRERFQYRVCVVASTTTELADDLDQLSQRIDNIAAIADPEEQRAALLPSVKPMRGPYGEGAGGRAGVAPIGVWMGEQQAQGKSVAFAFSGQGAQHVEMGREVYRVDPVVRGIIQQCCHVLREPEYGGLNLLPFFESNKNDGEVAAPAIDLSKAALLQPLLFVVEYSLARALLEYGVEPLAVIGHSIGEIGAAAFAKAMNVRDALKLMVTRGRLCDEQGRSGQMLSVSMGLEEAQAFVLHFNAAHKQDQTLASEQSDRVLEVALNNATNLQVLVGSAAAVSCAKAELEKPASGVQNEQIWKLGGQPIRCVVLHVQYPFHSSRMQAVADGLVQWDAQTRTPFSQPSLPMTSNVHSNWLQGKPDADYWAAHLTRTVRFAANAKAILKWSPDVVVEVGPGVALSKLFSRAIASNRTGAAGEADPVLLHTMRSPRAAHCDGAVLWTSMLARLWTSGVAVDWTKRNEYLFRHSSVHARPATPSGLSRALQSELISATDDAASETAQPPAKRVGSKRVGLPTYAFEAMTVWNNSAASIYVNNLPKTKTSKTKRKKSKKKGSATPGTVGPALRKFDTLVFTTQQKAVRCTAQMRIYCFPFAGGSARSFTQAYKEGVFQLHGHPEGTVDVVAVELPGRGQRAEESLPTTAAEDRVQVQRIAADILADVADLPRARLVLVGLSMGALWALETAKQLQSMGLHVHELAIVGRCPITIIPGKPQPAEVSKEDVEALAMVTDEIRATPEWKTFFLPLLVSDLATDSRFQRFLAPALGTLALDCDVTVVCGMQDKSFDWKRALVGEGLVG